MPDEPVRRRSALTLGLLCLTLIASGCVTRLWEPTPQDVLQRTLPSAVQIVIEEPDGRRVRAASGVAIASRPASHGSTCFVLTSGHTVAGLNDGKQIFAVFGSHRAPGEKVRATVVVARDSDTVDLALLRADSERCVPARSARAAVLGESVWVVGFPFGRPMTLASGVVSQVNDAAGQDTAARLMVDASVSYGSSGGGVYEAREGRLLGVVEGYDTARVTSKGANPAWYVDVPVPGQTFVSPLVHIRRFLAETGHAELMESDTTRARITADSQTTSR
ncbi:MAG TPA: serine protease [Methylomirabilota bacterium]|jgi:S1-C subfamily serine protease|nr:serine protease [Methylomirabilota bacterium]